MTLSGNTKNIFGFTDKKGSVLTKRTMMYNELVTVLDYVCDIETGVEDFKNAIIDDNCTGKRSGATRNYTYSYLKNLYGLDPSVLIFRALRYFWQRDIKARPLLAFLCAFSRDSILKETFPFVQKQPIATTVTKDACKVFIQQTFQGRFGENMTDSLVRNLMATWKQASYLEGFKKKVRTQPELTAGGVSYALFLGFLQGISGEVLFETKYCKLMDYHKSLLIEKASEASRKGWIVLKRIGNVIEVLFPNLITSEEKELFHEQN